MRKRFTTSSALALAGLAIAYTGGVSAQSPEPFITEQGEESPGGKSNSLFVDEDTEPDPAERDDAPRAQGMDNRMEREAYPDPEPETAPEPTPQPEEPAEPEPEPDAGELAPGTTPPDAPVLEPEGRQEYLPPGEVPGERIEENADVRVPESAEDHYAPGESMPAADPFDLDTAEPLFPTGREQE